MKRGLLLAIALTGTPALPAMAQLVGDDVAATQDNPIERDYDRCLEAAGSIDSDMAACTYQAAESWDAEMNATYRKLMDALEPEQREALREAQRRWIAFRDAEFDLIHATNRSGGTIDAVIISGSQLEIVKRRALELSGYLQSATYG